MTNTIRLLDILLSGLALIALAPFFVVVMIALRLTGEGEVFYRQMRVGKGGRMFGLLKFVTMGKYSENTGSELLTIKNDPRVLPLGRVLRKTKINELPQLVNVFMGDMSLIGMRPLVKQHFEMYPEQARQALSRGSPGLSGIGSIVFRDEESIVGGAADKKLFYQHVVMPYKGQIELWYLERQGIGLYFTLMFLTLWAAVFSHSNLYRKMLRDLPEPPAELAGI